MLGLGKYHHSLWMKILHQGIRDLCCHLFLKLKSSRKYFHSTRKLAKSHYLSIRNIGNMNFSVKGQHMMLAHGIECNIFFHNHFIIFCCKCLFQVFRCILIHSATDFFIHSCNPVRCFNQSFSVRIFTDSFQQKPDCLFYFFMIYHNVLSFFSQSISFSCKSESHPPDKTGNQNSEPHHPFYSLLLLL